MIDYETRSDMIFARAFETFCTNVQPRIENGLWFDDDERNEMTKTVHDAVNNEYTDDISDSDWLAATLNRLGIAY